MKVLQPGIHLVTPKLKNLKPTKDKLCLTTQEGHHIIRKSEITHLVADSNYTSIFFNDQKIVCSQTIGAVLQRIDHPSFIRVHKSHVFNIDHLKKIDSSFTTVYLKNGIKLGISRSRKEFLRESINKRFD